MSKYQITEIGPLPGGTYCAISGVNMSGDAVGWADTTVAGNPPAIEHAFYRNNKTGLMTDLHLVAPQKFGGQGSRALDINNNSPVQVVGWAQIGNGHRHAFLWSAASGIQDLGVKPYRGPGDYNVMASAINDWGAVVGSIGPAFGSALPDSHAFLWFANVMSDINGRAGWSEAEDINFFWQVVGAAAFPADAVQPTGFSWDATNGIIDLNNGRNQPGGAQAINDSTIAIAVGQIDDHAMLSIPLLYRTTDLFNLAGGFAFDISDPSPLQPPQVVGRAQFAPGQSPHAFILDSAVPIDLNTLIDDPAGWELSEAVGISNNGQYIVGNGQHNGNTRGFLLSRIDLTFHYVEASYTVDKTLWLLRHWFDPGGGPVGTPSQQLGVAFAIHEMANLFGDVRLRDQIQKEAAHVITVLMQRSQEK